MDLTVAIELIKKYTLGHSNFVSKATIFFLVRKKMQKQKL